MKVCVFVLYHDDESLRFIQGNYSRYLHRWMFPLKIPSTRYMESIVFLEELDRPEIKEQWVDVDLVGCIGWRWKKKHVPERFLNELMNLILEAPSSALQSSDVLLHFLPLCGNILRPHSHPHMESILQHLFPDPEIKPEEISFFSCNYWMTSPALMTRYIQFLREIRTKMETDPVLETMLMENALYQGKLSPDRLRQLMDRPYYTHHCFVMERMPCIFFHQEHITPRLCHSCHKDLILKI